MLERAVTELLAAGDVEGAAEAETTLCEQFWLEGETAIAAWSTSLGRGGFSPTASRLRRRHG